VTVWQWDRRDQRGARRPLPQGLGIWGGCRPRPATANKLTRVRRSCAVATNLMLESLSVDDLKNFAPADVPADDDVQDALPYVAFAVEFAAGED
jgi:hypothetical protein